MKQNNKMRDENLENSVITLHAKGWPIRRISLEMGISRGRVRRWLVSNSVLRDTTPGDEITLKKKRQSKLDPYKVLIAELLDKYSNITGQRVYEHLRQRGFDGKITIVGDYLKSIREVGLKIPIRLVETDPGQRAAHDWSDYNIRFTSQNPGVATQVTFFSYILCYSRRQEERKLYIVVTKSCTFVITENCTLLFTDYIPWLLPF